MQFLMASQTITDVAGCLCARLGVSAACSLRIRRAPKKSFLSWDYKKEVASQYQLQNYKQLKRGGNNTNHPEKCAGDIIPSTISLALFCTEIDETQK
jgi:hypothetical protein